MLAIPAYTLTTKSSSLSFTPFSRESDDDRRRPSYFWGNNLYGLADPTTYGKEETVRYPRQVGCWDGIQLVDIAFSDRHAAAIDTHGNVYQWGEAFWQHSGIFGTFYPVCTLKGRNCVAVRANPGGVYAITGDGAVVALDLNAAKPPQQVRLPGNIHERIVDIQAGENHLMALGAQGTVFTAATNRFGNIFGQLGRGPTDSTRRAIDQLQHPSLLPDSIMSVISTKWPRQEKVVEEEAVTQDPRSTTTDSLFTDICLEPIESQWWGAGRPIQIAAGDHHSLVLTDHGHVYGFGSNEMLQLGLGEYDPNKAINAYPVEVIKPDVSSAERCTFIAAASESSYFVMDSPTRTKVMAVGFGQHGQLGNKTWTHAQGHPAMVHSISNLSYYDEDERQVRPIRCRYITCGREHAAAVMDTFVPGSILKRYGYDVYVWGGNREWQLGLANKRSNVNEPTSVEPPDPTRNDVDYTDLALSRSGPTADNPAHTVTFVGGQLQILPEAADGAKKAKPAHRIHCGRDVTVLY